MDKIVPDEAIVKFVLLGILAVIIPITALIVYKKNNKETRISSFFIGCGTFFIFALVLEQICHTFALPLVQGSVWAYAFYGAFAAGIFEETGRFVSFRLFFKGRKNPKESVMYGLGHGGFEAALLVGASAVSAIIICFAVNSIGLDAYVQKVAGDDTSTKMLITSQILSYKTVTWSNVFFSVFERIIAMIFHTAASVIVFEAAIYKKAYMYPVAILLHAVLDFPVALYQKQFLSMNSMYAIMLFILAGVVFIAGLSGKRITREFEKQNAEFEKTYQAEKEALADAKKAVSDSADK